MEARVNAEVNSGMKSKMNVDTNGVRTVLDRSHNPGHDCYLPNYTSQNDLFQSHNSFSNGFLDECVPQPYTTWSTQEADWPRVIPNNRNMVDSITDGSETDLYGLVSNILEEPELKDTCSSYISENLPPSLKGVWSPKLKQEDNMQCFKSEMQMSSISGFPSNTYHPKPLANFCQQPAGRESQQWTRIQNLNGFESSSPPSIFTCNNESGSFSPQDVSRPSALNTPPASSFDLYQIRKGKSEYISPEKEEEHFTTPNSTSDYINSANNSYYSLQKTNDAYINTAQYFSSVSKDKLRINPPFPVQGFDKLTYLLAEQEMNCKESAQNVFLAQKNYEEIMAEQKCYPFQRMSELVAQAPDLKKEMSHKHWDQNKDKAEEIKTFLQRHTQNDFSGFGPSKSFSSTIFPSSQYTNKEASPLGRSMKQFWPVQSNHYPINSQTSGTPNSRNESQGFTKLSPMTGSVPLLTSQQLFQSAGKCPTVWSQGNAANLHGAIGQVTLEDFGKGHGNVDISHLEMQQENKNRLLGSLMFDQHFVPQPTMKPKVPGFSTEAEKKASIRGNSYQSQESVYGGQARYNGSTLDKDTPTQYRPFLHQMVDSRKGFGHKIQTQPPLPPYCSMPVHDMNELLLDADSSPFSPYLQERARLSQASGDQFFPGFLTAMTLPKIGKAIVSPNSQLHFFLEECYEQWRMLEKERKNTERILTKTYPGKFVPFPTTGIFPKMPPNPSRVDRLIADQLREHARVTGLLGKLEQLRSFPLHASITSALDRHLEVIYITHARRKDELINVSCRQRQPAAFFREDSEIVLLASALNDLCNSTRKARTSLWCALQLTLPKTSS